MIDAVEIIKDWLVAGGFNANYRIQADEWRDDGNKNDQFIVLYANGGTIEGSLQQNPGIRMFITGKIEGKSRGSLSIMETAIAIIDYAKATPTFDCLALIQPISLPSGTGKTENRRPFLELNFTTIIK